MARQIMLQHLFDLGVRGLGALPQSIGPRGSALLGRAGYCAYGSERRLALWNLEHCYGLQSDAWRRQAATAFFEHLVTSAYEVFHAVSRPAAMERLITIEHADRLTEAVQHGKGVIAVSGHFGNFALLPFILRSASPDPAFIARASKRKVGPLVQAARAYYRETLKPMAGMRVLPSSLGGVRSAAQLLRQGDLLLVFADLTWGMGELPVRFLGVEHRASRAPASLALRTGAALLPMTIVRRRDGSHCLTIEEPIAPPATGIPGRDAERDITECFMRVLEAQVQEQPEQWYWLHRSWRPAYPSILR
jgi:KDO2-lipid IV(A) lauroyltransferase